MRALVAIGLLLVSTAADAYVGPGLGLGVLGAILGGVAAVFLALVGVVWYPLKRLFKKRKGAQQTAEPAEPAEALDETRDPAEPSGRKTET